jgi:TolB-like protein/DNA-binding winged helix-turn-helix (wHTH) protein/tetratricopeptide (TPR) repeat protein
MASPPPISAKIRFATFELDSSAGKLFKSGIPIKLQPQPLRVLLLLTKRPGQVVTREEIQRCLWGDATFVDFERGINFSINQIRAALSDRAEQPRFIETLPRKGYRFIASVEVIPDVSLPAKYPQRATTLPETRRNDRPFSAKAFGAVVAILLFLLVGVLLRKRGSPRQTASLPIRSLAVLPLENLSGDPLQDYFADGMTDQLITDLGKLSSLRVISRTSVMQYKGVHRSLPQIARELNVDGVVEGTALKSGSHVRITAQLIEASTDRHLWAQSYEGDVRDLLGLQNQVANAIADEIRIKLTPQEQVSLKNGRAVNPEAYEDYLKGRYFWNRRNGGGLEKAVEYYQRALRSDSNYAPAYAGLAQSYVLLAGLNAPIDNLISMGKSAAHEALSLDPSLAEAHTALALLTFHEWNFPEAEREYKLAVTLGPNYATAHDWYGDGFLVLMGRFEETNQEMKQALALDPVSRIIATDWGQVLRFERRYDEAYQELSKVLELDPEFSEALVERGLLLLSQRKYEAALADLEAARRVDKTPRRLALLGYGYGLAGKRAQAKSALRELHAQRATTYVSPWAVAIVHIGLGENDKALVWLEKAYRERSADCIALKVDPLYDPLRSDPRFQDLMRLTGLPQ